MWTRQRAKHGPLLGRDAEFSGVTTALRMQKIRGLEDSKQQPVADLGIFSLARRRRAAHEQVGANVFRFDRGTPTQLKSTEYRPSYM